MVQVAWYMADMTGFRKIQNQLVAKNDGNLGGVGSYVGLIDLIGLHTKYLPPEGR